MPERIVACYRYCDIQGRLLYEVVRYHPKRFEVRDDNGVVLPDFPRRTVCTAAESRSGTAESAASPATAPADALTNSLRESLSMSALQMGCARRGCAASARCRQLSGAAPSWQARSRIARRRATKCTRPRARPLARA